MIDKGFLYHQLMPRPIYLLNIIIILISLSLYIIK